jgi:CubicO group peptidase (beta-lactamase class C family)
MTRQSRITAIAEGYVDRKQFSSIEWRVEAHGKKLHEGQAGLASIVTGAPIPTKAIYRIFSMTKPIVSVMALILIEQGKLRLYDMLPQYNPAFRNMRVLLPNGELQPANRPITVEDLLTHRSGFSYEFITGCHIAPGYDAIDLNSDGSASLDEMMERLATQPLAFQPGTQFRYSVSTDALAHILEKVTGKTMGSLLREYIFEPLDMLDTDFQVPADKQDRLMPMFGVKDIGDLMMINPPATQELTPVDNEADEMNPSDNPEFSRGGLGLYSTLDDYCKFARMLLTGCTPGGEIILSRKMLDMFQKNRIPPEQLPLRLGMSALSGYGWGLGVRVMMDTGKSLALTNEGEFGWAGAAGTYFWVDPKEQMVGVIMTQYLGSILPLSDDLKTAAYQMLV